MALVMAESSGETPGAHRPTSRPLRSSRNFSKFHDTGPGLGGCEVSQRYKG